MELSKRFANSNHTKLLMIGDENPLYEMKNTSTLIAKFNYEGGQKAVLGVIGSMRIDYESYGGIFKLPQAQRKRKK